MLFYLSIWTPRLMSARHHEPDSHKTLSSTYLTQKMSRAMSLLSGKKRERVHMHKFDLSSKAKASYLKPNFLLSCLTCCYVSKLKSSSSTQAQLVTYRNTPPLNQYTHHPPSVFLLLMISRSLLSCMHNMYK